MRWWEFYVVRYAMGTIVGGIVFFVLCSGSQVLKPLVTHLEYLAAFGLVYCYIASAPILVFHAGRFLFKWHGLGHIRWGFLPPIVSVMAAILTWWLVPRQQIPNPVFLLYVFAIVIGVFIFCVQGLVVCRVLFHSEQLWDFYKKLSERRENANKGGVIESYRHLREHGNSFFIVFLEVLLGIILVVTSAVVGLIEPVLKSVPPPPAQTNFLDARFVPLLVILVIWILPAVLVWAIATQFERKFSEEPLPPAPPSSPTSS